MLLAPRKLAFVVLALALCATGCNSNAKKIVGKWKVTQMGDEKAPEGIVFYMEFKADGTGAFGLDAADKKDGAEAKSAQLGTFKYKVSGDTLEITDTPKDDKDKKDGVFKKDKAKIVFEGDNLTITPEGEKTIKLTKMK